MYSCTISFIKDVQIGPTPTSHPRLFNITNFPTITTPDSINGGFPLEARQYSWTATLEGFHYLHDILLSPILGRGHLELVEDDSGKIDTLDPLHELDNFENVIINQETNYEEEHTLSFSS